MRGDARRPHGGQRPIEGVSAGSSLVLPALTVFVIAAAVVGGLFVGVHFGR
jgi:hypothetical protein